MNITMTGQRIGRRAALNRALAKMSAEVLVGGAFAYVTPQGNWRCLRTENGWSISRMPTTPRKGVANPAIGALATHDG